MSNWTLEGGTKEIWTALKGVALVGHDRSPEYGNNLGPIVEVLIPARVARVFGVANPDVDGLWWWWRHEDRDDLGESALDALSKVSLQSTVFPTRVPLREAQNLIGKKLTREGLAFRGFLPPIDTTVTTPHAREAPLDTDQLSLQEAGLMWVKKKPGKEPADAEKAADALRKHLGRHPEDLRRSGAERRGTHWVFPRGKFDDFLRGTRR